SGPAVGTAANLCAAALGSETDGSVLAPASLNGLVGLKPTVGLLSGHGVVPISARQDSVGPLTRTVADAALLLPTMGQRGARWDGVVELEDGVHGLRLGLLPAPASAHPQVLRLAADWFQVLRAAGCTLVDVVPPKGWDTLLDEELEVLLYDFKAEI